MIYLHSFADIFSAGVGVIFLFLDLDWKEHVFDAGSRWLFLLASVLWPAFGGFQLERNWTWVRIDMDMVVHIYGPF